MVERIKNIGWPSSYYYFAFKNEYSNHWINLSTAKQNVNSLAGSASCVWGWWELSVGAIAELSWLLESFKGYHLCDLSKHKKINTNKNNN